MEDKLTPEQRAANLERCREYLETLAPSLKLSHVDSYAFHHYVATGHVFCKGCCVRAKLRDQARDREPTRGL